MDRRTLVSAAVLVAIGALAGWLAVGGKLPVTAQTQAKAESTA